MSKILLAYYGDDFTGSTDALEFLCTAGANAMLFIEPPTTKQLQQYPNLNAYGIAGKTRSLPPTEMENVLEDAFKQMKATQPKHVHYKVCSTFDSAPHIGSIGTAIDCGLKVFNNNLIPVVGGTPALGRYCVFGNLFAQMGIGSNGKVYRLDKHPSMSKHPVTPSAESDLRVHLSKQTNEKIGLIDIIQMQQPIHNWTKHVDNEKVVLLDALYNEQLITIGEWMEQLNNNNESLFSVGGSSIEMALGNYWQEKSLLNAVHEWPIVAPADQLLVVSGSCSPVTAAQIAYAKQQGFEELILDAVSICNNKGIDETTFDLVKEKFLNNNQLIVHTGNKQANNLSSAILGTALGLIAKYAITNCGIKRVIVAGGDTSSYAARAMEIEAVEMIASVVKGAPLCKAHSANKNMNGLEVNFKGGQVGSENYFTLF